MTTIESTPEFVAQAYQKMEDNLKVLRKEDLAGDSVDLDAGETWIERGRRIRRSSIIILILSWP